MIPSLSTTKRALLAGIILIGLVTATGCLEGLTNEEVTATADPAAVNNDALAGTSYELTRNDSPTIERSISVLGMNRTFKATSHIREYERNTDIGPEVTITRLVVISTPKKSVAGQSVNPLGEMSNGELIERFLDTYNGVQNVESVGNRSVSVLGDERTVERFSAEAQIIQGISITVNIHITTFEHEGDYITVIGAHPEQLDEQAKIDGLMGGLKHPA